MPPKTRRVLCTFRQFVIIAVVILTVVSVAADGPVSQIAGVVVTADNDTGSGEQWGRAGGRSITYTVGNTSAFSALSWGATQLPSAAFDNAVDSATETMTFDANSSDFSQGVARWLGQAMLPQMNSGPLVVPTRFTLTVTTTNDVPVPLSNIAGGPTPGINVKSVSTFTANLLFEAFSGGVWQPLLTYYDNQPFTPPGNPPGEGGPVLTSFSKGFYFTDAPTGMTLEEHDANITQRLNNLGGQVASVKDDTAFMRIETVNRLVGVGNSVNQVQNGINQLLSQGGVQLPPDLARQDDVRSARDDLQQMLLILFGLMPCPAEAQQMCESATLINDVATQASVDQLHQKLNNISAAVDDLKASLGKSSALELEVVELSEPVTPKRRRWLLRTSVNGVPAVAELAGLVAVSSPKQQPAVSSDVTSMATTRQLLPGLMEVVLEVGSPNLADLAFQFSVRHSLGSELVEAQALIGDVKK